MGVAKGQFDISFIPFIAPGYRFHISARRLGLVPMFFCKYCILYMPLPSYLYRVVSNNTYRNGLLDVVCFAVVNILEQEFSGCGSD